MCPKIETIYLEGNLAQTVHNEVKQFMFIVNSCSAMADIRADFGQDPVVCEDYDTTLTLLDQITVNVQVTS